MEYYKATAKQLFEELERLQYSVTNKGSRSNQAIQLISKTLCLLRKSVQERGFESIEDEIYFFKHTKPQITGHLIFYRHIFDIEAKRMAYPDDEIESYINEKKRQFTLFIKDNLDFVYYYQNRYTHMDRQYFIRDAFRVPLPHQNTDAFHDQEFTTPYDHIAAKIVTKDLFYKFLITPIETAKRTYESKLKWTESKASLIELIYALNESGAINAGKTDIKTICQEFERIFNFELKDIYSTYRDITLRKTDQTKFLNKLSENFTYRISKSDEF